MGKEKKEADLRFNRFGTVAFTATTKVNDFIDYLEKGEVRGTKCKQCGMVFFPPRADCHGCLSSDMEWFPVTGKGKLITFSQLMYAPVGFTDDVPYVIAVLDYGDYKVFGRVGDVPFAELSVGMELATQANQLANGQINYVFNRP